MLVQIIFLVFADTALTVMSRFILLDSILLFYMSLSKVQVMCLKILTTELCTFYICRLLKELLLLVIYKRTRFYTS